MSAIFLDAVGRKRIRASIAAAERLTSGEIRVRLQPHCSGDPRADAERWFEKLGMTRTAARNGALIFVAWKDRQFAIVGDAGIHAEVGADFWRQTADTMAAHFAKGDFTSGLEAGVAALGKALASRFPRQSDDRNELSNDISEG
ncbi:MAG: TPM domain-containing protein [Kiritimatiellae bacterium]|nr:TPM domain-containing protein [Kiritimatiellia bacterium]